MYTGAPFSLWEADPKRPPKAEPKVSVLEAQISTILLFSRPGDQNRLTKERMFFRQVFLWRFFCKCSLFWLKRGGPRPAHSVKSSFCCFWCRARVQKRSEFDGFWDCFGVPPGSFFGHLSVEMITFLLFEAPGFLVARGTKTGSQKRG